MLFEKPITLWHYETVPLSKLNGYVLIDTDVLTERLTNIDMEAVDETTNISLPLMTVAPTLPTNAAGKEPNLPVAFLDKTSAEIYKHEFAEKTGDERIKKMIAVPTSAIQGNSDVNVYLNNIMTFECDECKKPITQMIACKDGPFGEIITLKCPSCGHEQSFIYTKNGG